MQIAIGRDIIVPRTWSRAEQGKLVWRTWLGHAACVIAAGTAGKLGTERELH